MSQPRVMFGNESPVQASITAATALKDAGQNVLLFNQGAEETQSNRYVRETTIKLSSDYQKQPGGSPGQRQIAADFLNNFLGYGVAGAHNTFILTGNGRNGLDQAFRLAAYDYIDAGYKPAISITDLSWPMVMDLAGDSHITHAVQHEMERGQFGSAFVHSMQQYMFPTDFDTANPVVAVAYSNVPGNNPTGLNVSVAEMQEKQDYLDQLNIERAKNGQPLIVHIVDNPYFGGMAAKEDEGAFLENPFEGVVQENSPTPTIFITSGSKALATATPGMHMMTFSDAKMAKAYETWGKSKNLLSYSPELMALYAGILHPDNYPNLKADFNRLHTKYAQNNRIFEQALGADLIDGDPGMVRISHVTDDMLNKRVEAADGYVYEIKTTNDVLSFMANEFGIVAVNQSVIPADTPHEPRNLIRWALKGENASKVEQGALAAKTAYAQLRAAPALEA